MSMTIARQVIARMNLRESLFSGQFAASMAADLFQLSSADPKAEQTKAEQARVQLMDAYGFSATEQRKPFAFAGGVAVIPVHGSLINRFGASWGYVTGYNFIRAQLNAALADDEVKAIVFDCNSYGGEVVGCFELADEIYAAREKKPLTAVVDANCYSACYAIASSAHRVVVIPSGGAGSIGAYAMHISIEKALEKFGVSVELIHSGEHKVDGNPFQDLPENVRADIQSGVNKTRSTFVSLVARNRGLDEKVVRDTEAACYRADEALALGLIDAVATPTQAIAALLTELSGSDENQENDMSDENAAPGGKAPENASAGAVDAAAERKAEQERCKGILNCEEAKGNPALANHLAFETSMSVDDAKKTLAAAGPAKPAVEAPKVEQNPFKQAMDAGKHPDLGAGGDNGGGDEQVSKADRILQAHGAASGRTYDAK